MTLQLFNDFMKGYFWGFVSFPVAYYVAKTQGAQIITDVKALWKKYV